MIRIQNRYYKQMEIATASIKTMLSRLTEEQDVSVALLKFTRQLELECAEKNDIFLFIFGLRSFFCWDKIGELINVPEKVKFVRDQWIKQNDETYTKWLLSSHDNNNMLTWSKWTFQAKNSILSESITLKYTPSSYNAAS
jgi:hypothetical protein